MVVNIWPPAANTTIQLANAEMQEAASVGDLLVNSLTVNDFSGLMSRNNMLPIIVFAILSGVCVSAAAARKAGGPPVKQFERHHL